MKKLSVSLDDPTLSTLKSQAGEQGLTRSALAATYIKEGVAAHIQPVQPPAPAPVERYFSVWSGTTLDPGDTSLPYIKQRIQTLCPWPDATLEWYVKAGEAGTWQRTWDNHPLVPNSEADLKGLYDQGAHFGVKVVPYVVVRGRAQWGAAEWEQIRACVRACGVCVLNLEPGGPYWNGATDPQGVQAWFDGLGVPASQLFLTTIPRYWVVDELGGVDTLKVWLANVAGCSWETYGATADDLKVDVAIPRMQGLFGDRGSWYYVPIVNQSEIAQWAGTALATPALQAWNLYSD